MCCGCRLADARLRLWMFNCVQGPSQHKPTNAHIRCTSSPLSASTSTGSVQGTGRNKLQIWHSKHVWTLDFFALAAPPYPPWMASPPMIPFCPIIRIPLSACSRPLRRYCVGPAARGLLPVATILQEHSPAHTQEHSLLHPCKRSWHPREGAHKCMRATPGACMPTSV